MQSSTTPLKSEPLAGPTSPLLSHPARPTAPAPAADQWLDAAAHQRIVERFTQQAPSLIGDSLIAGFICGSAARGRARHGDDIDMVVWAKPQADRPRQAMSTWARALHAEFAMQVDESYPLEWVTTADLDHVQQRLPQLRLSLDFNDSDTFDVITWAEMFSCLPAAEFAKLSAPDSEKTGARTGMIGDLSRLEHLSTSLRPQIERVRQCLLDDLAQRAELADLAQRYFAGHPDMDVAGLGQLSLPRIMRRVVPLPQAPLSEHTSGTALAEAMTDLPVLLTRRLRLRPLRPQDAADVFVWSKRPQVAQYCSWPAATDIAESQSFVRAQAQLAHDGDGNPWALTLRGQDTVIGTCGLMPGIDEHHHCAELGFAMHDAHWGKGLMSEAAERVLGFAATLGLREITANCDVLNVGSAKLLRSLGFEHTGRRLSAEKKGEAWVDLDDYRKMLA